ncbi:MAG: Crp/Fnr family transcriptional regulator [Deltaproteobacteria bacterium]|nr:Crp/Fnr family transcriptional regulator [Deltaproteobacteria bacterium]
MTDIAGRIAAIPLFEGLPAEQLQDLAGIVEDLGFGKAEIIFSEGDEGAGFYVVTSGRVKIFKLSPEGKEQILHIFGAGEPFGEVPVFAGQHFPANAEAMEESRLFFFPRESFVGLIRRNPGLALNMLAVLSRRLRVFTSLIEDLSLKEVPGRLAAYLLYLSNKKRGSRELELTITKAQLASLLGTIPETLSRILGKMSGQGLIESDGRKIRILDPEALESLAQSGRGR